MRNYILVIIIIVSSLSVCQVNDDTNNRYMLGMNYTQAGEYEKAKTIFSELYNNNPYNLQFFQALNDVLIKLKEYESSKNLIQQKITITPEDINLYGMLGATYYLNRDEEGAYRVWDEALQKLPQSSVNYRVIANYAIERRAFEKAIAVMKKGKLIAEDPNMFSYDLVNLYIMTMGFKDAAEELCSIITANPDQLNAVEGRLFSYINKAEALAQTITVFEDCKTEDNLSFYYLLGRLYKEQKSFEKAYEYYKELDNKQGNEGAELYNFAQSIYNEGEYKIASEIFNDIIARYPGSPFISLAKLGYAKTTEALIINEEEELTPSWKPYYSVKISTSGNVKEVISAYRDLTELYAGSDVANESLLRMGKLTYFNENNPAEAGEFYQRIIKDAPLSKFSAEAGEEMANIMLINGNLDEAKNYLEKVVNNGRAEPERRNSAKYKLANIYFYQGNFDRSKEILAEILDNLKDNNANDAIELSLLLNTTMNDSSNLVIFAEAELLAEQKKFSEAKDKYQLIAQNPRGFMVSHLAKIRVAEMELAMDKYETSVELFSKIADENEKNIYADKALYLLGQIYQYGLNNLARAVEIYESLLAKFPNSLYLDEAREAILKLRNKVS